MIQTLFILLVLAAQVATAQRKPITLEAYEEYHSRAVTAPSEPVWSPTGTSFAYRENGQLKIFDVASRTARAVVELSDLSSSVEPPAANDRDRWQNRGVVARQIIWNPQGSQILYEESGDLLLIDAKSGKWRNLTRTPATEADPKFSPDGTRIAFRRAWDLYVMNVASGRETRLTANGSDNVRNAGLDWVYPEELDLGTAYWWSPDSRSILYLQFDVSVEPQYPHAALLGERPVYDPQRYPQAGESNARIRVGVIPAGGGATNWMDPGDTVKTYLIARAGWTPDSRQAWIVRTNRTQNELEMILFDASESFSTGLATKSGSSRVVYQEKDPYWINIEGDPIFLPDSRAFLWTSERDGFRHLYLFPVEANAANGGKPKQLTHGSWQVTSVACSDFAAKQVYYVSTEASPVERQLYRIGFDGTGEKRISEGSGSHRISMGPGCSSFLDTYSNLESPVATTLRAADGAPQAVYRKPDRAVLDEFNLRIPEIISFEGPAKTQLYGRLIKPPGFDPARKYPVIVNVYGGPHDQSVRNAWSGVSFDQVLAQRGYLVWQMDNRGTYGRGHAFETPVFHHLGDIEREDQRAGLDHLIGLGFVDSARIGVYGWSYGGFMTLNLLLRAPNLFRAGFAGAPVTNWLDYDTIYTERYMGLPVQNEEGYRASALVTQAAHLAGKLMIAQNLEDDNVLFQNTLQFTNALQVAGKQFEMQIYAGRTHGVTGPSLLQMNRAMIDFFDRSLAAADPR